MSTILFAFIAIAFGLLLFFGIQGELPEELAFLKTNEPTQTVKKETANGITTFKYEGWTVRQSSEAIELTKPMARGMEINGSQYRAPEVGILCAGGRLDLRIDTKYNTTGIKETPVTFGGFSVQPWDKSRTYNIFPKQAGPAISTLATNPRVDIQLSFAELGKQNFVFEGLGLNALINSLPSGCRP